MAMEKEHWPSISSRRSFTFFELSLSLTNIPTVTPLAFSHLFEASNILSSIQNAVYEPKAGVLFDLAEVPHPFQVLDPFEKMLAAEVVPEFKVYSTSWAIFSTLVKLPGYQD